MTVDLQIRPDQLDSDDQVPDAALGMPESLIRGNEKRHKFAGARDPHAGKRISKDSMSKTVEVSAYALMVRGFFWP
jgi:hypothetical protein